MKESLSKRYRVQETFSMQILFSSDDLATTYDWQTVHCNYICSTLLDTETGKEIR